MRAIITGFAVLVLALMGGHQQSAGAQEIEPPLGLEWPGLEPELFAPGIVNTDGIEINLVFNADYTEIYYSPYIDGIAYIYMISRTTDGWSEPRQLDLFTGFEWTEAVDMDLSPDGNKLYFLGITPDPDTDDGMQADTWVSTRTPEGWSLAERLPEPINTEYPEIYPTMTADGALWFLSHRPELIGVRDLFRAGPDGLGGFEDPVRLPAPINGPWRKGDTAASPDGRTIVTNGTRPDGFGGGDLYIFFLEGDDPMTGPWAGPIHLDERFNSEATDFCPMFSKDGRIFSYSRRFGDTWPTTTDAEIYWVDASVLEEFRPE